MALALLASGAVKTKAEAARAVGIHETSLKPSALQNFSGKNPVGRALAPANPNPDFLAITADVAGKRVSARDALSSGVEASIRVIAKHGPRIGKLTKAQRAHMLDAKRFIELARTSGLFAPVPSAALPAELGHESAESEPDADPVVGSLADFVGTAVSPPEAEAVAPDCKVEA